jgi:dTDP-6-deoxy-L-talose 4-dehydrogenase (NAD+)
VQELLHNNFRVIATSSSIEKAKVADWFNKVNYIPFNFDGFDDSIDYFSLFQQPDILIHLAWEGLPDYKEDFHLTKNLPLQKNFLQNLLRNGLKDLTVTGTCFEYGMKDGCLTENMECEPANAYAIAKNELRIQLEKLTAVHNYNFKWVRLFYMYGKGQSPKSLISQLDKALENGDVIFNMSGGEQLRDFLPIEKVAANIVAIATQQTITGIINCCSGIPVAVKVFVEDYLKSKNKTIKLNLGYYPYPDYEAMRFWGDNSKLKLITGIC